MGSPSALEQALARYAGQYDEAVAATVRAAAARVPAFAERLTAAGLNPAQVSGVRDLDALPVLTKDQVLVRQRQAPPFGGLLAPDAQVRRIFQSPGPLYEPQLAGGEGWRWSEALRSAGFTAGDTVLNCFGYHLSPAGAMLEEGALALGCTVLPAGVGSMDLQVQAVADAGVTAYTGLPSYLKALIEKYQETAPPDRWRVRRALVTAEPLPDSLRAWLTAFVPEVHTAYGTAETGLLAYEPEPGAGLRVAEGVLVQVCDPDGGAPLTSGEGEVVVTLLRPEYPLVRFGTGDLSRWTLGPDGQPHLDGVLGRVGQAVKVRGMFLHPSQVEATMRAVPGVDAFRFVIDRVAHRDVLRCEVAPAARADRAALPDLVRARVRDGLRLQTEVELVDALPAGTNVLEDRRDWS